MCRGRERNKEQVRERERENMPRKVVKIEKDRTTNAIGINKFKEIEDGLER